MCALLIFAYCNRNCELAEYYEGMMQFDEKLSKVKQTVLREENASNNDIYFSDFKRTGAIQKLAKSIYWIIKLQQIYLLLYTSWNYIIYNFQSVCCHIKAAKNGETAKSKILFRHHSLMSYLPSGMYFNQN